MARKTPSSARRKAEAADDERPLAEMLGFLDAIEEAVCKHEAANGKSLVSQEARMLLIMQRWMISLSPDSSRFVFQMTSNAIALGAAVMKLEVADLHNLWKREHKRKANWKPRPRSIDPANVRWVLEREEQIKRDPIYKKKPLQSVVDARLCHDFEKKFGRKVSPRTLRKLRAELRGKNSDAAKKNAPDRGKS